MKGDKIVKKIYFDYIYFFNLSGNMLSINLKKFKVTKSCNNKKKRIKFSIKFVSFFISIEFIIRHL